MNLWVPADNLVSVDNPGRGHDERPGHDEGGKRRGRRGKHKSGSTGGPGGDNGPFGRESGVYCSVGLALTVGATCLATPDFLDFGVQNFFRGTLIWV